MAFVQTLSESQRGYADDALYALAKPSHPYHAMALEWSAYLATQTSSSEAHIWFGQPFFAALMRPMLDRMEATGTTYTLEGDGVRFRQGAHYGWMRLSEAAIEADPRELRATAESRACDDTAKLFSEYLAGTAAYDPIFKDADMRLAEMRAYLDTYGNQLRPLTGEERKALKVKSWNVVYVPRFAPLKARATAAEVAAGRAVFSLSGRRTPTFQALPATGRLVADRGNMEAPRVLIVQAERDAFGVVHYGIVEAHRIREVAEREIEDVVPEERATR